MYHARMTPVGDPTPLFVAGAILLACFAGIGMIDGAYFHLWKYKLHTRPDSHVEHITHTLNAILFPPIVYLLLYRDSAGIALWAAVALVVVDIGIESWDVLIERASRSTIGGLSSLEYWIHTIAISLRIGGIGVLFAARPVSAWSLSSPSELAGEPPSIVRLAALVLIVGATITAAQHLWLLQPKYRAKA